MIYAVPLIEDFVPKYRKEVLSAALRIPVAMEVIALAKSSYEIYNSDLSRDAKIQKLGINGATLALSIIASACNTPTVYIATSLALGTLAIALKTYKNPAWINETIDSYYKMITDTSTPFAMIRNGALCLAILPLVGFSGQALKLALSGNLIQFSHNYARVNPAFLRQVNHPVIVYAGHIAMGIVAAQKSYAAFKNKDYANALFYSVTAPITLASPFFYHSQARHLLRWHHFSYGVAAMLTPFRSFKLFGTMMAMDGMSYFFKRANHPYDYSNIFAENAGNITGSTLLGTAMQMCIEANEEKKGEPKTAHPSLN